jgi:hypothetical protein
LFSTKFLNDIRNQHEKTDESVKQCCKLGLCSILHSIEKLTNIEKSDVSPCVCLFVYYFLHFEFFIFLHLSSFSKLNLYRYIYIVILLFFMIWRHWSQRKITNWKSIRPLNNILFRFWDIVIYIMFLTFCLFCKFVFFSESESFFIPLDSAFDQSLTYFGFRKLSKRFSCRS